MAFFFEKILKNSLLFISKQWFTKIAVVAKLEIINKLYILKLKHRRCKMLSKIKVVYFVFFLFVCSVASVGASPDATITWTIDNASSVVEYRAYLRYIFEDYDVDDPSWHGPELTCTFFDMPNGVYYIVIRAFLDDGSESPRSNEQRFEIRNGVGYFDGDVQIEKENNGVRFILPAPATIEVAGYKIQYRKDGGEIRTIDIAAVSEYFLLLSDGVYEFDITPYNEVHDDFTVFYNPSNYLWPTLEIPQFKIEASGIGLSTKIIAGIKPPDDLRVDSYNYYIASTYSKAINREGDICSGNTINRNIIKDVPSLNGSYDMVFVAVSPLNEQYNVEGDISLKYVLHGNIINTANDGILWDQTDVYYMDFNVFGYYYGQAVPDRLTVNDYETTDLWEALPFSYLERADFDGNGVVNFVDYNFFGQKYGHLGKNFM